METPILMLVCINKHSVPELKNEINNILSPTMITLGKNLLPPDIQLLIMNIRKQVGYLNNRWAEIILRIIESKYNFEFICYFFIFLDNRLFLTQKTLKKKSLIVSMESIWAEAMFQLELELQLLIKNQIIENQ